MLDNLGTHVPLTEQGVAQNDAALDRQDAQQLQGGLVFVGLGVHAYLGENGFLFMSVGRHEVVARQVAIAAATQGFAVEGNWLCVGVVGRWDAGSDPAGQGCLEGVHVESVVEVAKARRSRGFAATEAEGMRQVDAVVPSELSDGGGSLAAAEHGQDGQGEEGQQRVSSSASAAWVGNVGERFKQGKGSHRGNLHNQRARLPRLLNPASPANLNLRIALGLPRRRRSIIGSQHTFKRTCSAPIQHVLRLAVKRDGDFAVN